MTIIAAITLNRGLGRDGDMLFHISADLKRFKAITMGHALIMGRRTFESFPNGPLPGRRNLVITRHPDYYVEGIETYGSLHAALSAANDDDPMIIGGGQIYAQAMPMAHRLLITEIEDEGEGADTFFPEINPDHWEPMDISEWEEDPRSGRRYRFVEYRRSKAFHD